MTPGHVLPTPRERRRRLARRLAVAIGAATVAGCAVVLGLSAALDVEWAPGAAVFLALTAVWLPQSVIYAGLRGRRK